MKDIEKIQLAQEQIFDGVEADAVNETLDSVAKGFELEKQSLRSSLFLREFR